MEATSKWNEQTEVAPAINLRDKYVIQTSDNMSRMLNNLLLNTYITLWLQVGGQDYKCLWFDSNGTDLVVALASYPASVLVPWNVQLKMQLGETIREFSLTTR